MEPGRQPKTREFVICNCNDAEGFTSEFVIMEVGKKTVGARSRTMSSLRLNGPRSVATPRVSVAAFFAPRSSPPSLSSTPSTSAPTMTPAQRATAETNRRAALERLAATVAGTEAATAASTDLWFELFLACLTLEHSSAAYYFVLQPWLRGSLHHR